MQFRAGNDSSDAWLLSAEWHDVFADFSAVSLSESAAASVPTEEATLSELSRLTISTSCTAKQTDEHC